MAPASARGQDAGRAGSGNSPPRNVPRLTRATAAESEAAAAAGSEAAAAAAAAAAGPPPQEQPSASNLQIAAPLPVASCLSGLVELNVGGTLFTTNRATLEESQPQSMLAALVNGGDWPPRRDAKVGEGGRKR